MAEFDYFIQPRGPEINVSLFSDAAMKGIQAGNAMPSATTAIIEGAQKGLKTGLELAEGYQQNQIRQNQVEMLPIENEIRREQLENMQLKNEVQAIDTKVAVATENEQLRATKADLENKAGKFEQENQLRDRTAQFSELYQSLDAMGKKQIVMSGQFNDVFAANPKLFEQAAIPLLSSNVLNDQERKALQMGIKRAGTVDFYDREAYKNQRAAEQLWSEARENSLTDEIANKTNFTPDEIAGKVTFVPAGKYKVNSNGTIARDQLGNFLQSDSKLYDPNAKPTAFDAVIDGRVVSNGVDEKTKKLFEQAQGKRKYVDGTYKERALQKLETPATPKPSAPKTSTSAQQSKYTPQETTYDPVALAEQRFDLTPEKFERRGLHVWTEGLSNLAQKYVQSSEFRGSAEFERTKTDYKREFINSMLDYEWAENPSVRAQYTKSDVEEFNKSFGFGDAPRGVSMAAWKQSMAPYMPKTPIDLYKYKNYRSYEMQLDALFDQYVNHYQQKTSAPARAAVAKKSSLDFAAALGK